MGFEEKLNEMYQEIANHINDMIPTEWEQVYTMAYIDEEGEEAKNIRMKIDYDEESLRPIGFAIEFISQGEKQVRYIDNI